MIEFELETKKFQDLVNIVSINGIIEYPVLQFFEDKLKSLNTDISGVVFIYSSFIKDWFAKYTIESIEVNDKDNIVCFDSKRLLKAIKLLSGETVKVKIQKDKDSINISTSKNNLNVPIMSDTIGITKVPRFIEEKEDTIEFKDIDFMLSEKIPIIPSQKIESLGEEESVFIIKDGNLSIFQKTNDGYKFSDEIKSDVNSVDFAVSTTTSYLVPVFKSLISDEVEINLGKNLPVILLDKTKDYNIVIALAPRIKVDENE